MAENEKTLADLLASLSAARADHVLIGGLAAGYWGKPRATVDVDMLIPKRAGPKVKAQLEARGYRVEESTDMLRAYVRGETESAADLVWREANPALKEAAKHTMAVTILGHRVNLIGRAAFVALKYQAAVSDTRDYGDKQQDVTDIIRVLQKQFGPADEKLAVRIVEKKYHGAGKDLAEMLDDIRHKRPLRV
jgi:hypothetical protein